MSYSTRAEVRDMVKDDALNAIIGDTFIEDPAEREELVSPIIDAAIADADAEIDGYLAKRYAVPLAPAPRVITSLQGYRGLQSVLPHRHRRGDGSEDLPEPLQRGDQVPHAGRRRAPVSIGTETEDPASAAAGGFKVKSNSRLFTREKMRGM